MVNQGLCDAQKTQYELRETPALKVRELWDKSVPRKITLTEALDLCRQCCDQGPFLFNNANTFATIGKTLLEDWLNNLPSVEAQIVRTTIGHYIADYNMVRRDELLQVLSCFDAKWPIDEYDVAPLPAEKPAPQMTGSACNAVAKAPLPAEKTAPQMSPVVGAPVSQA